ncbi:GH92 family glycosyl hydrolase [Isoptericola cucumis]|uniref:Glycosidase n=1 Tax=Isoptericola cucumis TaxID=1776856 RepID=A0ABQ2B6W0_9MICO|nr:GH92 family glycosyl hydrolase [Isoptericola cucumis]GGI09444.1 putative glycosidase [Isoptericola cucumis]
MTKPRTRTGRERLAALVTTAAVLLGGAVAASPAGASDGAPPRLVRDPVPYVDPMVGTGQATGVVGEINNFPGPSMPFGMMQLSPDTQVSVDDPDRAYAGYRYSHEAIRGFSLTHAAAGCNIFGDVPILPVSGDVGERPWERSEKFSHDAESAEVGRYEVTLQSSGIEAELSAATRSGGLTFDYPADGDSQVILNAGGSLATVQEATTEVVGERTVSGSVRSGGFCGKNNTHTLYYAVEFDQDFEGFGTWEGEELSPGVRDAAGKNAGSWLTFAPGATVNAKVAISYVSAEGARANLDAEIPDWDFDAVRDANRAAWADQLRKIRVAGRDADDLTMFYTSLYHSLLHPNTFSDVDGRYIGFDGEIHHVRRGHEQYANFSDWDTYRSLGALQAMIAPDRASDMAQSLVNDAEQSGWLPRWPVANQHVGQMTGDSSVPLIASMHAFGARDFDVDAALEYMVKGATEAAPTENGYIQRRGIETYLERGYAPQTEEFRGDHRVVGASITLEWSIADFAIGQLAGDRGDDELAAEFAERGQYWQNVFDPSTRTAAARNDDGTFVRDEAGEGFGQEGFDEGNAEQYTWLVPQDVAGLTEALGGREAAADRLDEFVTTHNSGPNDPHLWIGNEPNFGVPWLYDYLGQPWRTSELVDELTSTLFQPVPDGKPGNDDLGAQAGWYVWAAMGLYPTTPGTNVLALNSPRFDRVVVDLPGRDLDIRAPGASSGARYITGAKAGGRSLDATWLPERTVERGGLVRLDLSTERDTSWGTGAQAAPPSFRDGEQPVLAAADAGTVTVEPGGTAEVGFTAQLFGDLDSDVSARLEAPDGVTGGKAMLESDGSGRVTGTVPITLDEGAGEGFHDAELVVSTGDGAGGEVRAPLTIRVADAGSLFAAYDTVGSASAEKRASADLDGAGNSYSREALADAGLAPGSEHTTQGLGFTWPSSPDGRVDSVTLDGQTVRLDGPSSGLSFVGTATNGTHRGDAVLTFDDGSTAATELAFGDWVLPSDDGSPVEGNEVVARVDARNGGDDGAFVFATSAYTAPEGKQVVSVRFPSEPDLHVFAIATDRGDR